MFNPLSVFKKLRSRRKNPRPGAVSRMPSRSALKKPREENSHPRTERSSVHWEDEVDFGSDSESRDSEGYSQGTQYISAHGFTPWDDADDLRIIPADLASYSETTDLEDLGVAVLELIPIDALTELSRIHPFVSIVFLPFKLLYEQEMKRKDSDRKIRLLVEKMADVVQTLTQIGRLGLEGEESRLTQDKKYQKSRLTSVCEALRRDIDACSNVIDLYEKRGSVLRYLTAGIWNQQFAKHVVQFETRNRELNMALNLKAAADTHDMKQDIHEMKQNFQHTLNQLVETFASYKTPYQAKFEEWIEREGGKDQVMKDNQKCRELLRFEVDLIGDTSQSTAPPGAATNRSELQVKRFQDDYFRISQDVDSIIRENFKIFTNVLELRVDVLHRTIEQQGNRIVHEINRGPHERLEHRWISDVWKDQNWRGSVKTWKLVLAIRDYLLEQAEITKANLDHVKDAERKPMSFYTSRDSLELYGDGEFTEAASDSTALRDAAVTVEMAKLLRGRRGTEVLQIQRLRNLQEVLDPDTSGFSTISEVNAFTRSCPTDWSLTLWILYWTIGWPFFAAKYCNEIEDLFAEMVLLRDEIGRKMPENRLFIEDYLDGAWAHVIPLTSGIDRTNGSDLSIKKFTQYIQAQEDILTKRLKKINYIVNSPETILQALIRGEPIERSLLMLITVLMRRHRAKMHLCLTEAISENELSEDFAAIATVTGVAWERYCELLDRFKHQQASNLKQIFEWFSCGLFKHYNLWGTRLNGEHYRDVEAPSSRIVYEISEVDAQDLKGILVYNADGSLRPHEEEAFIPEPSAIEQVHDADRRESVAVELHSETSSVSNPESPMAMEHSTRESVAVEFHSDTSSGSDPESPMALEHNTRQSVAVELHSETSSGSDPESPIAKEHIDGIWIGFHADDAILAHDWMFEVRLAQSETNDEAIISETDEQAESSATTTGRITGTNVSFDRKFSNGTVLSYQGYLKVLSAHGSKTYIIIGTYDCSDAGILRGSPQRFILKPGVLWNVSWQRDPKNLWKWAIQVAVDRTSRGSALVRLQQRMKELKLYVENSTTSVANESDNIVQVREELNNLAWRYRCAGNSQSPWLQCDGCGRSILRARIMCLDCKSKDVNQTVDFGVEDDCISTSILINRDDMEHKPSHLLLKARNRLLLKDIAQTKKRAVTYLKLATRVHRARASSTTNDSEGEFTRCLICKEEATAPCWYCLDCSAVDAFVCNSCEKKIDSLSPWKFEYRYRSESKKQASHTVLHRLIRFGTKAVATNQTFTIDASGLQLVESKMTELLDRRYDEISARVQEVERKMDERLERIERWLEASHVP